MVSEAYRGVDSIAWAYDNPEIRELLHKGLIQLDESDMVQTFLDWKDDEIILGFHNEETDEWFEKVSPKRGNSTCARNQRKKAWEVNQGLNKLELDYPVPHSRNVVRDTHLLQLTLTFDQQAVKKEEAWHLLTSKGKVLNRFSATMSKVLGTKATWKVKEGTGSGYPAPHILLMLDQPVRVFRYRNAWRLQSEKVLERLRKAWSYGFIDVRAVISNRLGRCGVVGHNTKYLTKSMKLSNKNRSSLTHDELKKERMFVLTHVWNKVFKYRDVLSKAFKQRLNRSTPVRREMDSSKNTWSLDSIDHKVSCLSIMFPEMVASSPIKCELG